MEEDMKGFRTFINSSKRRIENFSSTLTYSTGGIPPINGQCPDGFVSTIRFPDENKFKSKMKFPKLMCENQIIFKVRKCSNIF